MYTYKYPRPMVTVDMLVLKYFKQSLQVLLIKRKHDPYKDKWALPGGYLEMDESLLESAERELKEETALTDIDLIEFGTYGQPGRDPRGRTITVLYLGILNANRMTKAGDDAKEVHWFGINDLPPIAFDHNQIIQVSRGKLLEKFLLNGLFQHFYANQIKIDDFVQLVKEVLNRTDEIININKLINCLPGFKIDGDILMTASKSQNGNLSWIDILNTIN